MKRLLILSLYLLLFSACGDDSPPTEAAKSGLLITFNEFHGGTEKAFYYGMGAYEKPYTQINDNKIIMQFYLYHNSTYDTVPHNNEAVIISMPRAPGSGIAGTYYHSVFDYYWQGGKYSATNTTVYITTNDTAGIGLAGYIKPFTLPGLDVLASRVTFILYND